MTLSPLSISFYQLHCISIISTKATMQHKETNVVRHSSDQNTISQLNFSVLFSVIQYCPYALNMIRHFDNNANNFVQSLK